MRKKLTVIIDKTLFRGYNTFTFKFFIRSRGRRESVNEESPSVSETGCRRNPGEGDFKESATEINRLISGKDGKAG